MYSLVNKHITSLIVNEIKGEKSRIYIVLTRYVLLYIHIYRNSFALLVIIVFFPRKGFPR